MDASNPSEVPGLDAESRRKAGNSRGGKNHCTVNRPHRQTHGSYETPNGRTWFQLKADYESGAFSVMDLHKLYMVSRQTIMYRAKKEGWVMSTAPSIAKALPDLVEAMAGANDSDSVEALTAAIEGRPLDAAALVKEKAAHGTARKARIIHDHRDFVGRYRKLFTKTADFLDMYSEGRMPFGFVRTKEMVDGKEREVVLNFSLFSRQTGFIDAVDKIGGVLDRLIKLERSAHGIEDFDGDGRKRGPGGVDPVSAYRNRSTDELSQDLSSLIQSLSSNVRMSPVREPSGV